VINAAKEALEGLRVHGCHTVASGCNEFDKNRGVFQIERKPVKYFFAMYETLCKSFNSGPQAARKRCEESGRISKYPGPIPRQTGGSALGVPTSCRSASCAEVIGSEPATQSGESWASTTGWIGSSESATFAH
jgi:hypothetical protein